MEFDYGSLLAWATELLKIHRIDNLLPGDLINEAYVSLIDEGRTLTIGEIKKYASRILSGEKGRLMVTLSIDEKLLKDYGSFNDSFAVCVKCGEPKHISEFGVQKGKVRSYCRECMIGVNKKNHSNPNRKKAVNNVSKITLYDQEGKIVLTAKSMTDFFKQFGHRSIVERVMYKKEIHPLLAVYCPENQVSSKYILRKTK